MRRPLWAGDGFAAKINHEDVKELPRAGSYLALETNLESGDTIALTLPKTLHLEPLPDNTNRVALLWGPLVLAGDLGPENNSRGRNRNPAAVPVLVAAGRPCI